jgi:class 3 adenylate cyclase
VSDPVTTATDPNAPSAERRQVTVLFADMVGFTAISERLGEEGTFALIQPIYELMVSAVKEQGGSIKDFFGDGVMALFGASDPLEDAPLRACRAGLLIHERLAYAAAPIEAKFGVRPQMRIGVNSGLAVVTQILGQNGPVTALGDTVNLASRLQNLAEPGTVYLSESTQRLVQGLVEVTFAGTHAIKGKAEPQKVYRLDALLQSATRFEAALARGLSPYVGRERELEILERALAEARGELRVIDIAAEPGMGKSRLLYEFRQRISGEQAFVLTGRCSPDGKQTPFLPIIEMVRGLFQLRSGEAENEVARKLEMGLDVLDLRSGENLGLLLNLLGLKPPERALVGLDAALIGLRTRALLQGLLAARYRSSAGVVMIEDLHWIDSASQDVLGKIVDGAKKLNLLILHTRRPEYQPIWRERPVAKTLRLEPLAAVDIRRLVQARLGAESPPETLVRLVIEKAEGNALFAEEILGFLSDRGALRADGGRVVFDTGAAPAALPASLHGLLTARVDRLAPQDRALLQAAAVIGRRFDPQLLAAAVNFGGDADARLLAMQAHDLVRAEGKSGDYAFKHALVRDALFQSLLTGPRAALHLKIAEEIERRSGNRLGEMVDALAHHYSQTDRADKAFAYLAMAGAKSLGVYSHEEADNAFAAAVALLDKNPNCADDEQVADLLANYTLCLNLSLRFKVLRQVVVRFQPRLSRLGDSPKRVLIQHHYVMALSGSGQYREAEEAQTHLTGMAVRLGDDRSKAYALGSEIVVSAIYSPKPVDVFETLSSEAIAAASSIDDRYLQAMVRGAVGWDEIHRGRTPKMHEAAEKLMAVGRLMNDPRSVGYGLFLRAWAELLSNDYASALDCAEASIGMACTPFDREGAVNAKVIALVLLRRPEAFRTLKDWMDHLAAIGWNAALAPCDGIWGVALVLHGEIGSGIRWIEQAILKREREGYLAVADWYRMFLCEIYLEIISGKDRPPMKVLLRNFFMLATVIVTARKRIPALVERVRDNSRLDPDGCHIGRCEMILGLLYKAKRRPALAIQHLTEAKRILSQSGSTPVLAKIEAALTELA